MKYVSKPKMIEAVQYNNDIESFKKILDLLDFIPEVVKGKETDTVYIKLNFGYRETIISDGDYLIKDGLGIFSVLNSADFENKYKVVGE